MDLIDRQAAIDASESEKQTLKELMIKYGFSAPNMTVTEFVEDILPSVQPEPCEDVVSKEAVSSWLKQYGQDVLHGKYKFSLMYIWKNLMDLPSVTPKHRWIPCSERLPYAEYGESDTVLATCGYWEVEDESIRWIRMLYYDGGNWCFLTGEAYSGKVYAWMPLPEPYREEGGE